MALVTFYDHRIVHDILHALNFKPYLHQKLLVLSFLASAAGAWAATSSEEVDYPKDWMFSASKRYILLETTKSDADVSKRISLEDQTAGIIRFTYKDVNHTEEGATLEVIELDGDRSRLKLTLPSDFSGRTDLFLRKLVRSATESFTSSSKDPIPFDASRVYQAALRYLLKTHVTGKLKKGDVVKMSLADVGLIRFVYKRGPFTEPDARVEVLPAGKNASRILVSFPSKFSSQQVLFEEDLMKAVNEDLGAKPKTEEISDSDE
jgi:hypothetical protein